MAKEHIIHTANHPIRMLLDGYFTLHRDRELGLHLTDPQPNTAHARQSITLSNEFNEACYPYIRKDVREKAKELVANNIFRDRHNEFVEKIPSEMEQLLKAHPESFLRVAWNKEPRFCDWDQFVNDEGVINHDQIDQLPPLPQDSYVSYMQVCSITAHTHDRQKHTIHLPVPAETLFHALALAQDRGALLHLQMPPSPQQPAHLRMTTPTLQAKKPQGRKLF